MLQRLHKSDCDCAFVKTQEDEHEEGVTGARSLLLREDGWDAVSLLGHSLEAVFAFRHALSP